MLNVNGVRTGFFSGGAAEAITARPVKDHKPATSPHQFLQDLRSVQSRHSQPDMEVLEFGCGTGSTAREPAPHVARIPATNVSAAMISIGREKA